MKSNEISNFLVIAKDKALTQLEEAFIGRLRLAMLNGENHATPFASSAIDEYKEAVDLINKNYSAIKDMVG